MWCAIRSERAHTWLRAYNALGDCKTNPDGVFVKHVL